MNKIKNLKIEDALLQYFSDRCEGEDNNIVIEKTPLEKLAWDALVQIQIFERLFNEILAHKAVFFHRVNEIIDEKNRYQV